MPNVRFAVPLLSLVLPLACLRAQRDWTVDVENRPGADFVALQAACDAASPGDRLLIRGSSQPYAGATTSKGLTVLGEAAPASVQLSSELRVHSLPPGQRFVLENVVR